MLKDAGFTQGESRVYVSVLSLGESKVGAIIKKSGISRSKVYDILDRLLSRGVISKIERGGIMVFQALPPKTLLHIIKDKEKMLREEEKKLKEILPKLISLQPKEGVEVAVYHGYNGFKTVINQTIKELRNKDVYEVMGIGKTTDAMRHYARKIYEAQKKKKFLARSIFDESGMHKIEERKSSLHKVRVLPNGWETPALFTIYGDKVGIHMGNEKNIISINIKNAEIAKSFRATFKAMWEISK